MPTLPPSRLEDDLAALFERACRERELEIAEHLLRALEALARRDGEQERVRRALRHFAGTTRVPAKH